MKGHSVSRIRGLLLIAGAAIVNIPYMLLIANFDYPDILRLPASDILSAFEHGGGALVITWLAFAWSGLPILFAILLLPKALGDDNHSLLSTATTLGSIGAVAQMIGLLRWVFVVPGLAQTYLALGSNDAARQSAVQIFQAFHQFGGVLLGEHIGQTFTILWMVLVCAELLRTHRFPAWVGWWGIIVAGVYLFAQGELFATVIPGFPVFGPAGLIGSLLWLAWMAVLGVYLVIRKEPDAVSSLAR